MNLYNRLREVRAELEDLARHEPEKFSQPERLNWERDIAVKRRQLARLERTIYKAQMRTV